MNIPDIIEMSIHGIKINSYLAVQMYSYVIYILTKNPGKIVKK